MIYFTSDWHLGHRAALKFTDRPFHDVEEEAEILIRNTNELCSKEDDLYILGDFAYRIGRINAECYLSCLQPKLHLLRGNHDKQYNPHLFVELAEYLEITYAGSTFSLFHYPIESWYRMHYGGYMIHGHIHSIGKDYNLRMRSEGKRKYDVGVDANDFRPVSVEEIVQFFEGMPILNKAKQGEKEHEEV